MAKSDKRRARSRKADSPSAPPPPAPAMAADPLLPGWARIGALLLLVAGSVFGVLEVHSSNDTWIALAGGRNVLELPEFPIQDVFNYPEPDAIWFNQNWLSHVYFYVMYAELGRDFVIIGTWAVGWATFLCLLLAVRLRCGSWLMATITGGLFAIACRDWLSARPATIQFLLIAIMVLALQGILNQRERVRWWPVALLFALFVAWPHAHGSFIFGYGMVGIFLGCAAAGWLASRIFGFTSRISLLQMGGILVVLLLTLVLGVVLSPYGVENLTHPFKIAEAEEIRKVGEWRPPYVAGGYPPPARFWWALAVMIVTPLIAVILRLFTLGQSVTGHAGQSQLSDAKVQRMLFDVASIGIGFMMAMYARRFAPLFYLLALPPLAAALAHLARGYTPTLRRGIEAVAVVGAWVVAALTVFVTYKTVHRDLIAPYGPNAECDLLCRVTRNDSIAREALAFLARNELSPNVMTDWKLFGAIMFYAPQAKVFIDGRAQQVYSEAHYQKYIWLMSAPPDGRHLVPQVLEETGTDAIILPRWRSMTMLRELLTKHPDWRYVFRARRGDILARLDSPFFEELARREMADDLWWPDEPQAMLARGDLWAVIRPNDMRRAAGYWREAIDWRLGLGQYYWPAVTQALLQGGGAARARTYLAEQTERVRQADGISPAQRSELLQTLAHCERMIGS